MRLFGKNQKPDRAFSFRYYWRGLPQILYYQIPTKLAFYLLYLAVDGLMGSLLSLTGIFSVSSGELPSILLSWRGWLVLAALALLYTVYTALDVIILILLGRNILYDQNKSLKEILTEALRAGRKFLNLRGCIAVGYLAVIVPLNTAMLGIKLTKYAVPQFIYAVIRSSRLYLSLYAVIVFVLDIVGIMHLFTFHGVLFDDYSLAASMHESRALFFQNWKKIMVAYAKFFILFLIILAGGILTIAVLPYYLSKYLMHIKLLYHLLIFLVVIMGTIFSSFFTMFFIQAQTMCITRAYDECTHAGYMEAEFKIPVLMQKSFRYLAAVSITVSVLIGYIGAMNFDIIFPKEYTTDIIAHRGGGSGSTENTVESIRYAIIGGANASEIDVQRTKDGHYVIFHDRTLKRLCNVSGTIQDFTLEEIKRFRITGYDGHQVRIASLEEILNTAKNEIRLYIELKGRTADLQMAEDIYRMLADRDMVNQVRLISLDAGLITEVERRHPDIETEYLCFLAVGNFSTMNVDAIGLEEEIASDALIESLMLADKRVDVWTSNSLGSILRFMNSDVDGLITDELELAGSIKTGKSTSPDFMRVLTIFFPQL